MVEDGNGRVTLAIVATKLDYLIRKQEEYCAAQREDHDRLQEVAHTAKENRKDIEDLVKDVKAIDTREKWWSGVNTLLSSMAVGLWAMFRQP